MSHGPLAALLATLAVSATPPAASPATPLALAERQVTTLEFSRPVARLATTDPDLLHLEPTSARLKVTALKAGRAQVDVTFDDGAAATFDVTVAPLQGQPAAAPAGHAPGPSELTLAIGEERRLPWPGLARVIVEDGPVARVRTEGEVVIVLGVTPGRSSMVLLDGAGRRTTQAIRVR